MVIFNSYVKLPEGNPHVISGWNGWTPGQLPRCFSGVAICAAAKAAPGACRSAPCAAKRCATGSPSSCRSRPVGGSDQSEPMGKTCFRLLRLSSYAPGPTAHGWCLLKHGEIYVDWRKNVVDGVMKHKESANKCNKVVGQWLAAIWVEQRNSNNYN